VARPKGRQDSQGGIYLLQRLNQCGRGQRQGIGLGVQHGTATARAVLSPCTQPVLQRANVLTDVGLGPVEGTRHTGFDGLS
jgi:hypothetical protein